MHTLPFAERGSKEGPLGVWPDITKGIMPFVRAAAGKGAAAMTRDEGAAAVTQGGGAAEGMRSEGAAAGMRGDE